MVVMLWTTDQSTRPKATASNGLHVSKTIFHIFIRRFATVTKGAG